LKANFEKLKYEKKKKQLLKLQKTEHVRKMNEI